MKITDLQFPFAAAHRGVSSLFPENTMPAFLCAVNLGCQMIEFDVGVTKDNKLVIMHDETIDRTTNGTGKICNLTYSEILSYDAGLKLSKGKISTKVPLLEDVLTLVKNRICLNIEIKSEVYKSGIDEDSAEAAILDMVKSKNMVDQIIFSSFNHKILVRLRRLSEDVHIGILTSGEPRPPIGLANEINAFSWHPDQVNLMKRHIKKFKKGTGKKIIPYTVNKFKKAKKLVEHGIDGFFTDYPQKFV